VTQESVPAEVPLGTVARPLHTPCGSRSLDWRPPPHPAIVSYSATPESLAPGGELDAFRLEPDAEFITCSTGSRASSASLSSVLAAAARSALTAQLKPPEAATDATCEQQRNPDGEAVLDSTSVRASICVEV